MMRAAIARMRRALRVQSANLPWDPIPPARRAALHRDKARRIQAFRARMRAARALRRAA
jgi:hypothetical protein